MFQVKMYDDIGETPNTPLMEEGPTAVREFIGPTRLHVPDFPFYFKSALRTTKGGHKGGGVKDKG